MKILLYTHTEYNDVWDMFFGQTEKYFKDYEKIIFVNSEHIKIPKDYNIYVYNDGLSYTERMVNCLENLDNEVVIFQHEDMILYDKPMIDTLEDYKKYLDKELDFIKLIRGIDGLEEPFKDDIYHIPKNSSYGFSIQPTLCRTDKLLALFKSFGKCDIWSLERQSKAHQYRYSFTYSNESKRGMYHWDSNIYPYIATAITKGKWCYSEYKNELDVLFDIYGIDKNIRGIV